MDFSAACQLKRDSPGRARPTKNFQVPPGAMPAKASMEVLKSLWANIAWNWSDLAAPAACNGNIQSRASELDAHKIQARLCRLTEYSQSHILDLWRILCSMLQELGVSPASVQPVKSVIHD
ncbi:hypothetical protein RRG08_005676 [Elysia crispata]|uniref:Uncharacterized protein n=1 Tax=Elysia crispata TaxID=231223 RepID=A0AAE0YE69_9GAST|nr:hypothetical protein RRG08_005676 [Elysia crispata]